VAVILKVYEAPSSKTLGFKTRNSLVIAVLVVTPCSRFKSSSASKGWTAHPKLVSTSLENHCDFMVIFEVGFTFMKLALDMAAPSTLRLMTIGGENVGINVGTNVGSVVGTELGLVVVTHVHVSPVQIPVIFTSPHIPLWQSEFMEQVFPSAQAGQKLPPQSVSVSQPFRNPSVQLPAVGEFVVGSNVGEGVGPELGPALGFRVGADVGGKV
jgi:hypothetical protein